MAGCVSLANQTQALPKVAAANHNNRNHLVYGQCEHVFFHRGGSYIKVVQALCEFGFGEQYRHAIGKRRVAVESI